VKEQIHPNPASVDEPVTILVNECIRLIWRTGRGERVFRGHDSQTQPDGREGAGKASGPDLIATAHDAQLPCVRRVRVQCRVSGVCPPAWAKAEVEAPGPPRARTKRKPGRHDWQAGVVAGAGLPFPARRTEEPRKKSCRLALPGARPSVFSEVAGRTAHVGADPAARSEFRAARGKYRIILGLVRSLVAAVARVAVLVPVSRWFRCLPPPLLS
jgi:hypothetical protein